MVPRDYVDEVISSLFEDAVDPKISVVGVGGAGGGQQSANGAGPGAAEGGAVTDTGAGTAAGGATTAAGGNGAGAGGAAAATPAGGAAASPVATLASKLAIRISENRSSRLFDAAPSVPRATLMPRAAMDWMGRMLKGDQVLSNPDHGARAAYEARMVETIAPAEAEVHAGDRQTESEPVSSG